MRARTVGVIFALDAERSSLRARRLEEPVFIAPYQSGPGSSCAALAARRAIDAGADGLLSWGLAGGLAAELESGQVVVPTRVLSACGEALPTDPAWQARLVETLSSRFTVHQGDLLGVERVLESTQAKAEAAHRTGAVAADMESRAIAEVAYAARRPFAVVRVVADEARDRLPAGVERWVDESGRTRLMALLPLVAAPREWSSFLTLARRSKHGLATLRALAEHLAADSFCAGGG